MQYYRFPLISNCYVYKIIRHYLINPLYFKVLFSRELKSYLTLVVKKNGLLRLRAFECHLQSPKEGDSKRQRGSRGYF